MDVNSALYPYRADQNMSERLDRITNEDPYWTQVKNVGTDVISAMLNAGKERLVRAARETDAGKAVEAEATKQAISDWVQTILTSPITWALAGLLLVASLKRRG